MADEVDFRGEFKIFTDSNAKLLELGINKKNLISDFYVLLILLFICLLVITTLVQFLQILDLEKVGYSLKTGLSLFFFLLQRSEILKLLFATSHFVAGAACRVCTCPRLLRLQLSVFIIFFNS